MRFLPFAALMALAAVSTTAQAQSPQPLTIAKQGYFFVGGKYHDTPTGKIMAGLIGLARQVYFKPNAKVLFMHTGGLPSLHVYEDVVLGRTVLKD